MNLTKSKRLTKLISSILSIAVIISAISFQLTTAYGEEETTTYAHTINYPINLTNIGDEEGQTPAKGDGYEWDEETNTLTLNNLHIDFSNVEDSKIPVAGIIIPSDKEEITVIFNGENKITDVSIINFYPYANKVTFKGGSGNRENDSLEVCSSEARAKKISALGLGKDSHIDDLTMKMDLYYGSNFHNLTVKNSDISIKSYDSSIYCVGYFKATDSIFYLETENSSAIMANVGAFDDVPETDSYVCDEPINVSNCKITAIAPQVASMYTTTGNTVISNSNIDCGNSFVGLYLGDDITINNSNVKNDCMTLVSLNGKISIDESSTITGLAQERTSKTTTAYGKFTQTTALNSNVIGGNYTYTIDENAEITMADGVSMQITEGTLVNNGILKGTVENTSGKIVCNNHCLTEIVNNENEIHIGKCSVCGEENIQAKEIIFVAGNNRKTVYISSSKLNKYLIPENPTTENMTFECWSETKAENFKNDTNPFDFESTITKDTTLYAIFKRDLEENTEASIDLVYGQEIKEPIHLNDYVKFADKTIDTDEQLEFTVSSGALLLDGLKLNSDGTITGTPIEDVRENGYKVEFIVTDKNPYISLASLESETEQKNIVLTINFNILKADPTVTVKPMENLIYDTKEKVLIDSDNTSTNGGSILYSLDNINYSNELPKGKDANDYTIWYKVKGDNNYNDTEPKTLTVTIAKADPTVTIKPAENLIYDTKEKVLIDFDNTITNCGEILYSFDNINYSNELPKGKDANDYTIWYKVKGDNNYNDTAPKTLTITIAKADPLYEIPKNLTIHYGETLANIELPDGFAWDNGTQIADNIGTNTFKAIYTPNDTNNYNIITDIDITVNVLPPKETSHYGNVDGQIGITVNDASCLLKKVLDNSRKMPIEEEVKEYMTYADVNCDGKLTALDAAMILRKALDPTFTLPVECEN